MIIISSRKGIDALDEYDSILTFRIDNPLPDGEYGEVHHILPKSCGGGDEASNLVKLTPEEHFRCHRLLPLIFEKGMRHWKMVTAFHFMLKTRDGVEVTEEEYGRLKREYSKARSELQSERTQDPEYRRKYGEAVRRRYQDPEYRKRWLESQAKRAHDPEYRMKQGEDTRRRHQDPEFKKRWLESQEAMRESPEYRQKLSEGQKRRLANNPEEIQKRAEWAKKQWESPERRLKQSEMLKAAWNNPEYRREQSERRAEINRRMAKDPEWQRKQAEKNERLRNDPEYLKALSERTKKRMSNPEARKQSSELMKKNWDNPEFRKKMCKPLSEETKRKLSEKRKLYWAKRKAEKERLLREEGKLTVADDSRP